MQVLFAIAEADPFAKAGGLGDVGGSLPLSINRLGERARVILPKYKTIPRDLKETMTYVTGFPVNLGWRRQSCALWETKYYGVHYYFIENEYYFGREEIYGYQDDGERFAFFSRAVLESLFYLGDYKPNLVHCHDWHTALIPVMLKEHYGENSFYQGIKTLITIHNLRHQGVFPKEVIGDLLGMGENTLGSKSLSYQNGVNFLKGGLLLADGITTVSPSYAKEITSPQYGEGLEEIIKERKERLTGILNGIDYEKYNPQTDPALFIHYPIDSWKEENKRKLQEILNLPAKENLPLLAVVSRLADQKGLDLFPPIMEKIMDLDVQMVVLGTGEKKYEEMFRNYSNEYPDKLRAIIKFDGVLARKIYGGADMLLMPSRFEPCGLAQMMAMRYGTVPLVRETGGLKDSVIPFRRESGVGNGFSFRSYQPREFLSTVQRAVSIYRENQKTWQDLRDRGMQTDFSWGKSAQKYIGLYQDIISI